MKKKTPSFLTGEPARSEQVLLAPGHLFFCERIELPPELDPSEVPDFAELSLESLSPFPPDQLCWGYLYRDGAGHILLYATHRDRLRRAGAEELEAYAWVLPDFATLAGARFPVPTEVQLLGDGELGLLRFEADEPLPRLAVSRPLGETDAPDLVARRLREILPAAGEPEETVTTALQETTVDDRGLPTFVHATAADDAAGPPEWARLSPAEPALWAADIRDPDFKRAERASRGTSLLITRLTGWLLWLGLALLGGELLLLGGNHWLEGMRERREAQRPEVLTIQDRHSLTTKLDQVARSELRPVEMLESLNTSRPEGIYFTSATAEGENRITIEGIANTVNELNRYTEQLRRSGRFRLVEDPKALTRSGQTTFSVLLEFNPPRRARRATTLPEGGEADLPILPDEG